MAVAEKSEKRSSNAAVAVEPPPGKLLLTIGEVMYLTGYSERTVRSFLADGKLRDNSLDGKVRIRREDVLRLIDGRRPR